VASIEGPACLESQRISFVYTQESVLVWKHYSLLLGNAKLLRSQQIILNTHYLEFAYNITYTNTWKSVFPESVNSCMKLQEYRWMRTVYISNPNKYHKKAPTLNNRLCNEHVSQTCSRYLSQLMYSRSLGSCSLCVLMYCQSALIITGRVCVCIPSSRASRRSSLNCIGCKQNKTRYLCLWTQIFSFIQAYKTALEWWWIDV